MCSPSCVLLAHAELDHGLRANTCTITRGSVLVPREFLTPQPLHPQAYYHPLNTNNLLTPTSLVGYSLTQVLNVLNDDVDGAD